MTNLADRIYQSREPGKCRPKIRKWTREIGVDETGRVYFERDNTDVQPELARFIGNVLAPCEACELVVEHAQRKLLGAHLDLGKRVHLNLTNELAGVVWEAYDVRNESE